jgi:5-methylcytosine-specific restriction protein A
MFSNDEGSDTETPKMSFERIQPDVYHIEFIDPLFKSIDWTDEGLEAAVKAYFDIFIQESRGAIYGKAAINLDLRSSLLKNRSKGSVEFRMQNISAVLQELCHPIIKGYLPRGNVGTEV